MAGPFRYNTGNPVEPNGSPAPRDLHDNAANLDFAMNRLLPTWTDRLGRLRKSWFGIEKDFAVAQADRADQFQQFLLSSGYEFVGDYDEDGPLTLERINQIFSKDGELWRPSAGLPLPYTTVDDWGIDQPKMVSVGDAALRQELGAQGGAQMVGWERTALSSTIRTVGQFLDAQAVSVWEQANLITDKPSLDPSTWDWTPAVQAAAVSGCVLDFPPGTYTFAAAYPYTDDGGDRIAAVNFPSNITVRFAQGVTIKSRDYDGDRDYREVFLVSGQTNVHFTGECLFDGGLLPDASNSPVRPKVGIVLRSASQCSIERCQAVDFAYHGFAAYAGEGGGCSDIDFVRVKSTNGRASSLIAYSSAVTAGHAPNKRIRFLGCTGLNSGQYFGIELRGCEDSLVDGGYFAGNNAGGVNIEENSHRVVVRQVESTANAQGVIISGQQGACNDVLIENCNIHDNTASQVANYAGNRMRLVDCRVVGGGSFGVNILVPASLPVADGVQIERCTITGNTGIGVLMRGTNACVRDCIVTGNGTADVQVSGDGFRVEGGTIGSWGFDTAGRRAGGFSCEIDPVTDAASFNMLGRLGVDGDRVRLVGRGANGREFGTVEVVRQGSGSGRIEVYGYLASNRKHLATFTREGDIELPTVSRGVVFTSADGTRYRLYIQNGGIVNVIPA